MSSQFTQYPGKSKEVVLDLSEPLKTRLQQRATKILGLIDRELEVDPRIKQASSGRFGSCIVEGALPDGKSYVLINVDLNPGFDVEDIFDFFSGVANALGMSVKVNVKKSQQVFEPLKDITSNIILKNEVDGTISDLPIHIHQLMSKIYSSFERDATVEERTTTFDRFSNQLLQTQNSNPKNPTLFTIPTFESVASATVKGHAVDTGAFSHCLRAAELVDGLAAKGSLFLERGVLQYYTSHPDSIPAFARFCRAMNIAGAGYDLGNPLVQLPNKAEAIKSNSYLKLPYDSNGKWYRPNENEVVEILRKIDSFLRMVADDGDRTIHRKSDSMANTSEQRKGFVLAPGGEGPDTASFHEDGVKVVGNDTSKTLQAAFLTLHHLFRPGSASFMRAIYLGSGIYSDQRVDGGKLIGGLFTPVPEDDSRMLFGLNSRSANVAVAVDLPLNDQREGNTRIALINAKGDQEAGSQKNLELMLERTKGFDGSYSVINQAVRKANIGMARFLLEKGVPLLTEHHYVIDVVSNEPGFNPNNIRFNAPTRNPAAVINLIQATRWIQKFGDGAASDQSNTEDVLDPDSLQQIASMMNEARARMKPIFNMLFFLGNRANESLVYDPHYHWLYGGIKTPPITIKIGSGIQIHDRTNVAVSGLDPETGDIVLLPTGDIGGR